MRNQAPALLALIAVGATPPLPKGHLAFVACPVLRDTNSVPCWLTEYKGKTYYLTIQTDVSNDLATPMLGHRLLVEGVPSGEASICGGEPLKPLALSVMPDRADDCDTLIPADGYVLPFEPPRPPGPSRGRLAFIYAPPPPPPVPPFKPKSFTIQYNFDEMVVFKTSRQIEPVLTYANQIRASRVRVTGHQSRTTLSDGSTLNERPELAQDRARQIAELLQGAGLTNATYEVKWDHSPKDGGPERRQVEIELLP